MSVRSVKLLWFVVCLLASVQLGLARQQAETSAVIAGTVVDSGGGVIPGATVALEQASKTLATKVTDSQGQFTFVGVAAGAYRLRASLLGFKVLTMELQVAAGAKQTGLKLVLDVAAITETVTVMAATSSISTQTTTFSSGSARQTRGRDLTGTTTDERYGQITPNKFQLTSEHPLSTFAADVDTASYTNVRRFLSKGQLPPTDAVRVEELINYFRFPYAEPTDGRPVSITTELGDCPWAPDHRLALIGLRAKAIDDRDAPGRNITLLLDVSGSMAPPERLPLIKTALRMFVDTLRDEDRIAIVVYASASGLVLPATPGTQRHRIHDAIESLDAGGSTNGADGIRLAYQVARANFIQNGTNRVILATDGDFNVGITSHDDLVRLIERERESGVFLSVLGVGSGNLKDATMEMLADKGNGHYAYLDSLQEARRVLVREGGATLETVAKDVKFQVEFNPQQLSAYRLIGYENRLLADRDFNDDTKDAGELGAGHSVTVLYEIVPAGRRLPREMASGSDRRPAIDPLRYQVTRQSVPAAVADELMMVKVRYKAPHANSSELMTRQVRDSGSPRYLSFASAVAEFGLLLRDDRPQSDRWAALSLRLKAATGASSPAEREALGELVGAAAGLKKQR